MDRWLFKRAVSDIRERATLIVANSERTAGDVCETLELGRDRIRVIPLGVDTDFFTQKEPDRVRDICNRFGVEPGRFLMVLGTVSTRKNVQTILNALSTNALAAHVPEVLVVGPPGRGVEEIESNIVRLGLSGAVKLTGWLHSNEVQHLLSAACGLLHPSLDEGFGLTPLEAMASGTPALVAKVGAVPEVVGDAAVLLDPFDPSAWADAIIRVLNDRAFADELRNRGLKRSARFTWARAAERHIDVYREALRLS
jgi:glycosyltransferase involved in cell wall biosynthesis